MKIRSRIHSLVMLRISLLQHEKNISRKLLATLSTPAYFSFSAKRVWKTADIIWRLAGDSATDFNHYSKRALLSGVYSSTLLYWLQDESEKYCKTVTFLERRIAEVISFGQKSKTARDNIKDFFPPILKQAFSHE
jgi:ubiquinone biosynthesis protein COQ9